VDANIIRQMRVAAEHPCLVRAISIGVKVYDLTGGVDAAVCASGAGDLNRVISDLLQCILDSILYGADAVCLHLPATEPAAVVFHTRCYSFELHAIHLSRDLCL
jgi:hypothetical protein